MRRFSARPGTRGECWLKFDMLSGQVNYGVAKAGVTGLSKAIAKEWGPSFGVRANT